MRNQKLFAVLFAAGSLFFFSGMANAQPKNAPQHHQPAQLSHAIEAPPHASPAHNPAPKPAVKPAPAPAYQHHVAPAPKALNQADFNALLRSIDRAHNPSQIRNLVNSTVQRSYISINQLEQILRKIRLERDRIDIAVDCYDRITDKSNWNDLYKFSLLSKSSQKEINRRIHNKK